jgi:putative endonuclease
MGDSKTVQTPIEDEQQVLKDSVMPKEASAESTSLDEAPAESAISDEASAESQQISLSSKELGRRGERAAARFLERKGYEILDTNWACFAGEADIIALDGSTLCFIEVKTRTGVQKGFPAEAVDAKKRARYEKIAACYLQNYEKPDIYVRFDVISILVLSESRAFLRLHTNAFSCDH